MVSHAPRLCQLTGCESGEAGDRARAKQANRRHGLLPQPISGRVSPRKQMNQSQRRLAVLSKATVSICFWWASPRSFPGRKEMIRRLASLVRFWGTVSTAYSRCLRGDLDLMRVFRSWLRDTFVRFLGMQGGFCFSAHVPAPSQCRCTLLLSVGESRAKTSRPVNIAGRFLAHTYCLLWLAFLPSDDGAFLACRN